MKNEATAIANEIKVQISKLEANNQAYDIPELVYDYFAQLNEGWYPQLRLEEEVLNILID